MFRREMGSKRGRLDMYGSDSGHPMDWSPGKMHLHKDVGPGS